MTLRYSRTTTENVPGASDLHPANAGPNRQMQKAIEQEDKNNFTINKWRNKVTTDIRVRSKLKDKNYKMKVTEDVELTRLATQKILQQKYGNMKLNETPISVGVDAVVFSGIAEYQYHDESLAVKVWNCPGKELMESRRKIYEADPVLLEKVKAECTDAVDFPEFWAAREFEHLKRLHSAGVSCPRPLHCVKNILVMEKEWHWEPLSVAITKVDVSFNSNIYDNIVKKMRSLYAIGLIPMHLDENNVNINGFFFDAGRVMPKSHPMAEETVFKNCQRIFSFCDKIDTRGSLPTPEATFEMVTDHAYKPTKTSLRPKKFEVEDSDVENRKSERKSARSLLRKL